MGGFLINSRGTKLMIDPLLKGFDMPVMIDFPCKDARGKALAVGAGQVRVSRQTQGRGGKAVTLITGLPLGADDLAALAGELKRRCGSGGTVREGAIEIQGEHRDTLVAELLRRGFAAKRAGG